ncbi:glycosyltransferase family 39 protein, partial [Frankia sp. AiPs1]|uniref:ArnT family glycosyltransferase n=1 Tax=Frankia sp. AiPs1 TaxID=573493 RepID=UPI0020436C6F
RAVRGRPADPVWARPALVGLLAAAAVLYVWDLGASGYANSFYAAAVQAGTKSWKALLFGSLDSGNFITVDKPPASLWAMALSGRIFGFSSWSMLVPQALGGVAAVGLLFAAVRRWFGPAAGLLAGSALALTPVAALMFRFDNPDGLLTFVLVLAGYCLVRALEETSTKWMAATGAALGLAFLTKTLQGFLVLPAFALVYLIAAPTGWRRRVWQLLAGGLAIVVAAGWWVATVALWPKGSRPYIGGSTDNSALGLAFGYNGLGRIFGGDGNRGGGGGGFGGGRANLSELARRDPQLAERVQAALDGRRGGAGGGGGGFGGGGFGGGAGWDRLFGDQIGGQVSWLIPGALILLLGGLWVTRRAPRTDRTRAALLLWGAWMIVTSIVLSFAQGTFHPYYTASIAPGIAGLVGVGTWTLWRTRQQRTSRLLLAAAVAATGAWSFTLLDRTPSWYPWLRVVVTVAAVAATAALLIRRALVGRTAIAVAVCAAVAVLGGPAAFAAVTATIPQSGG